MKNRTTVRAGLLAGSSMAFAMNLVAQDKPNIIFFLVDDMGWQETSVPFWTEETALNRRYNTPNMERLAELGVKFTDAYACAISSPSRASLMSGMNAARHRVTNWTLQYDTKTDASSSTLTLPDWNYNGIQPDTVTSEYNLKNTTLVTPFTKILQENGYHTIHCGKAHFGSISTASEDPLTMGFDVNIAGGANGAPGSYLAADNYGSGNYHVSGLEDYYAQGTFLTEALTLEAIKAMEEPIENGQPFYLYMSHYAIHTPYNPDSRFTTNYMQADGTGVYDEQLQANLNTNEINHAALIEGMDKSLGDIMDFLEEQGVAENTIIIFMSDNGGQAVSVRQGQANYDQNYPLRAGKGSSYMGGVREPMIVYWPNVTEGGTTNDSRVMIEDFFPTILELAGVTEYETVQHVDGKSIVDVIRNNTQGQDRTIIWHFPNLWGESQSRDEGYGAYSAIMKGDYHLLYFWETQERRLYNVKDDIAEVNDLASTLPEVVNELSKELADSLRAYDAQRPIYTSTGDTICWPDDPFLVAEVGEVLSMDDRIFKMSSDIQKYYYRVADNRYDASSSLRTGYWTRGEHYGYNAIQASTTLYSSGSNMQNQLFYFLPGSDDQHFLIKTIDDENVDYVEGLTVDSWGDGNPDEQTSTITDLYLQYGTSTAGEFVVRKSGEDGYYLIGYGDEVLNNRGSENGVSASMKWVVNDNGESLEEVAYNGGSQYEFVLYDPNANVSAGSAATPHDGIFKYSNDTVRYYYNIVDSRGFLWTTGEHYGNPTIQISNEEYEGEDADKQLFYFIAAGSGTSRFYIYTHDEEPLIFTTGTTVDSWSEIQKDEADRTTVTTRYVQYGGTSRGSFQLIKSSTSDVYGLQISSVLLNDRGSAYGSAANMQWVVNGYSGNPSTVTDQGSQYHFVLKSSGLPTAIDPVEVTVTKRPLTRADLIQMGDDVQVYDIRGMRVRDISHAQRGLYIIRTATEAYKVLIK